MNNQQVMSSEVVWCPSDDRLILIMKEHGEIVGLNYMQGDDIEAFADNYYEIDHDLTDFYNGVKYYLGGETEIDRVNQAIWAHFDYKNRKHERKYGFMRPQSE